MATKSKGPSPRDEDLSDLNARAAEEARAACMPDAVNPPGTESGTKSVTTADTA